MRDVVLSSYKSFNGKVDNKTVSSTVSDIMETVAHLTLTPDIYKELK